LVNQNEPIFCSAEPKVSSFRFFMMDGYSEAKFAELEANLKFNSVVTGSIWTGSRAAKAGCDFTVRDSIPFLLTVTLPGGRFGPGAC
jgi:hypothetical protein